MDTTKSDKYIEAVGRRKAAVARVRIYPGKKGAILVNDKPLDKYFEVKRFENAARQSYDLGKAGMEVTVKVSGGGKMAQSEAIRLGLARALTKHDENLRGELKKAGYLMRDPREVERKKFGLKKARRAPQWSKR